MGGSGGTRFLMERLVQGKLEPINEQSWALLRFILIYMSWKVDLNSHEASDRVDFQLTPSGGQFQECL